MSCNAIKNIELFIFDISFYYILDSRILKITPSETFSISSRVKISTMFLGKKAIEHLIWYK